MSNPQQEKISTDPVIIEQLTWVTTDQACIYLKMYPEAFRRLVAKHNIPYKNVAPNRARGRRVYKRELLDRAMDADMTQTGLTGAGEERISTILGEST